MIKKIRKTFDYSVIILAAGKSSRMGKPKWSLLFDKNTSFIEKIVSEYYSFGCKQIILVINENDYLSFIEKNYSMPDNFKMAINLHPEWDRFYSLKLGVANLSSDHSVFVQNIDNPFVNHELLTNLLLNSAKAELIIPEYNGRGGHPILISKQIINKILRTQEDKLHFKEFLNQFSTIKINSDDKRILVNINTSSDYNQHFKF